MLSAINGDLPRPVFCGLLFVPWPRRKWWDVSSVVPPARTPRGYAARDADQKESEIAGGTNRAGRDGHGAAAVGVKSKLGIVLLAAVSALPAPAQVCRLSLAGLNQNRRAMGPIHVECPPSLHSVPFGNWGVTSNFGHKGDSLQFEGWCHDTRVCDNNGVCHTLCIDGWYEWNSCTDTEAYQPPNCTLYNAKDCTEQVTTRGINVHGTRIVDLPVQCPRDTNNDGNADEGGCLDVREVSSGTNFMTLYELDPATNDDLIQTMYFPDIVLTLGCSVWGCPAASSNWVTPSFYDSPASPAKVFAELAMVVNSGVFLNNNYTCTASGGRVATVSAASFTGPAVAPDSIASTFGEGLATGTAAASGTPLPTTLADTTATLTDSGGIMHVLPLFYVSPGQVNFLVPAAVAPGDATVIVSRADAISFYGPVRVATVAPGLFAANANGRGVAAAVAVRVDATGEQTWELVYTCAETCTATPIDLGSDSDQVYLLLFGTGLRGHTGAVSVTMGGVPAPVTYAGAQNEYVGLDQVNVLAPRSLRGRGEVEIALAIGEAAANVVTVSIR